MSDQKTIEEELAAFFKDRGDAMGINEPEETLEPAAPVVQTVVEVPVPIAEPIIKKAEPLIIEPAPTTKEARDAKVQIFDWHKTRLNLVLIQTGQTKELEILNFNGNDVYMNKPLNNHKISEEVKASGYLNKYFRGFAKALCAATKQDSYKRIGPTGTAMELYSSIALAITENTSKLLPTSLDGRVTVFGEIATEKNNFVNDVIFEFYVVVETDYTDSAELLDKLGKVEKAIVTDNLKSELFSVIATVAYPLEYAPENLTPWLAAGYSRENYSNTKKLPDNRDYRLSILGNIPDTKRPAPHVVLSKVL